MRVDGAQRKAAHHVAAGERVEVEIPPLPPETLEPEPIALTVVHEDERVLVRRQAGRDGSCIPALGMARGTLAAAVLAHAPPRHRRGSGGPRRPGRRAPPGQGHVRSPGGRRKTHGGLRIELAAQLARPDGDARVYLAVVHGRVARRRGRCGAAPIGRHPRDRVKMAGPTSWPRQAGGHSVSRSRAVRRFHPPSSSTSRRAGPTRFASISPRSAIRSWATRVYGKPRLATWAGCAGRLRAARGRPGAFVHPTFRTSRRVLGAPSGWNRASLDASS